MECMIIAETNFEKARKKILEAKSKNEISIFSSYDEELDRKILEKSPPEIFLINLAQRKDKQKQRESGFNHVLAKIAKKNKTKIGINLDEIIDSSSFQKAKILARLRQNIILCSKNKIQMIFIAQKEENQRNEYDLKSLGLILGMPTNMVRDL